MIVWFPPTSIASTSNKCRPDSRDAQEFQQYRHACDRSRDGDPGSPRGGPGSRPFQSVYFGKPARRSFNGVQLMARVFPGPTRAEILDSPREQRA